MNLNDPKTERGARTRVLFATIAAGGGHVSTARAMAQGLEEYFPGEFETVVSDFMFDLGLLREDRQHKEFWRWLLARPKIVRTGQRILDVAPTVTRRAHRMMLRRFSELASARLREDRFDLVVANHGWLTVGLTRAQERHGLATPVLTFATEPLDASALWAEPSAEQFVVPSEAARNDLVRLGVAAERIDVIGYPIGIGFLNPLSKREARGLLGMTDEFSLLVALGGEGVAGHPERWLAPLLAEGVAIRVLTGRNPQLRRSLAPLQKRWPLLMVEGFSDRVPEFLAASDVVLGKAGPSTVFEALAVGRPFIATGYAGLNELEVVRYLRRHRFGTLARKPETILESVREYRKRPELLTDIEVRSRALDLPAMNANLAGYIAEYARTGRPSARFVTPGLR